MITRHTAPVHQKEMAETAALEATPVPVETPATLVETAVTRFP
jgi:hypothetical protein